jgi:hypothetical protein
MDIRSYYKKVRETEERLRGSEIVLVSLETPEGGKPGVRTEAPRSVAARLIAEGRARAAPEADARELRQALRTARQKQETEEEARRVQIVVAPYSDDKAKERS